MTTKAKEANEFQAWPHTMKLLDFMNATPEQIKAETVTCENCPVSMMCLSEKSGNKSDDEGLHVCAKCNTTGLIMNEVTDKTDAASRHLLIIDCGKHQFKTKSQLNPCELCDGRVMKYHLLYQTHAQRHYLRTEFSKVPVDERQKIMKEKLVYWQKQIDQREKEIAKEKAKKAAEGSK